jgi:hypothetical protein
MKVTKAMVKVGLTKKKVLPRANLVRDHKLHLKTKEQVGPNKDNQLLPLNMEALREAMQPEAILMLRLLLRNLDQDWQQEVLEGSLACRDNSRSLMMTTQEILT